MSSLGSPNPFLIAGKKSYQIQRSLRFNSADSPRLNRTPSSDGNRKTWTLSTWFKRGSIDRRMIFGVYTSGSDVSSIEIESGHILNFYDYLSGYRMVFQTNQVLRDPSAWYHLVIALDTTQSTESDRVKIYLNGSQITSFSTSTYPSQNLDVKINTGSLLHAIGTEGSNQRLHFDGYMAEFNFIDGSQLTPSSFGETDAATGQWNPKKYTGSYGTNGYYLNFSDNSGTTATTLGKDSSGNGNNFTPNNFSVAAGTGNDSLEDTPTNNFPTLNPLNSRVPDRLSNGNLDIDYQNGDDNAATVGSFGMKSGKWYFEVTLRGDSSSMGASMIGISPDSYANLKRCQNVNAWGGLESGSGIGFNGNNELYHDGSASSYGGTWATDDVIGVAVDADAGKVALSKNGQFSDGSGSYDQGSTIISNANKLITNATKVDTDAPYFISLADTSSGQDPKFSINFGQRAFSYTAPTGYKKLCSANLPNPTIKLPNKHFGTLLYSAGSSNGTFTFTDSDAVDFFPDWTWLKCRSSAEDHYLFDALRGNVDITDKFLKSNGTDTETGAGVDGTTVSSIQNGLKIVETSIGSGEIYFTNRNYVTWNWNAGGSTVTNNDGSVASEVRVNTSAGFSIVTFSGSGNRTIGHGLGVAPKVIIMKGRNVSDQWTVGHQELDASNPWHKGIPLNTTATTQDNSGFWNDTAPTSTVFSKGTWDEGYNMVAYCFSEVAGYSKFGSYSANGDSNGPFVFTGFRPAWILIKNTDLNQPWVLMDNKINPHNLADTRLSPNSNDAEYTNANNYIDFLSNGFKVRSPGTSDINYSTSYPTHIYLAFAESPFKNARAR